MRHVYGVCRRRCQTLAALGAVLLAASARSDDHVQTADAVTPEFFPPPSDVERRYEAALEKTISVTFDETPVLEAFQTLSGLAGVPIRFDRVLQTEMGEAVQNAVLSGEFHEAPLRGILERIVFDRDEFDMPPTTTMYVAADGITVSVRELGPYTGPNSIRRIYPVGDLCESPDAADQLVDLLKSSTGMYWKTTMPDGGPGVLVRGVLYSSNDDDIGVIMMYAGSVSYLEAVNGLIVQTDPATHAEVLDMLRMLRQAKHAAAFPRAQPIPTVSTETGTPDSAPADDAAFTFTVPFTR